MDGTASAHDLAATLRPQAYGRARPDQVVDPVIEPLWYGRRVIASADDTASRFIDDGTALTEHADLGEALRLATRSAPAGVVIDGYITKMAFEREDDLLVPPGSEMPSTGQLLSKMLFGVRRSRTEEALKRIEAEDAARMFAPGEIANLVVTDLLWLEGTSLLDIPLVERKRLLDAVVVGSTLVRPGVHVRPPVEPWIGSWRTQGFAGITFKAANSRYLPGAVNEEWATTPMPRR